MAAQPPLWVGLDIGTTKVCAMAAMGGAEERIKVVGLGVCPSGGAVKNGVVVDVPATTEAIRRAVDACAHMAGQAVHEVWAGIAGSHIQGCLSEGNVNFNHGQVSDHDVQRVMDNAAQGISLSGNRQILDVLPLEFCVDEQGGVTNPQGMAGSRLWVRAHVITCASRVHENIINCCKRAGLRVHQLVLEPLASADAVLTQDDRQLGTLLIDIGGGTTDLALYCDGALAHTSVIDRGGSWITKSIAKGLHTTSQNAEELKREHGHALAARVPKHKVIPIPSMDGQGFVEVQCFDLGSIIESRLRDIFEQVIRELQTLSQPINSVVLCGGSSLIPGICDLAQQQLNCPARLGFPQHVQGLENKESSPMYATGCGLLSHAMQSAPLPRSGTLFQENALRHFGESLRRFFQQLFPQ